MKPCPPKKRTVDIVPANRLKAFIDDDTALLLAFSMDARVGVDAAQQIVAKSFPNICLWDWPRALIIAGWFSIHQSQNGFVISTHRFLDFLHDRGAEWKLTLGCRALSSTGDLEPQWLVAHFNSKADLDYYLTQWTLIK